MKNNDKFIYSILVSASTVILLIFLYNVIFSRSIKQNTTDRYLSESVNGVVDTVFNDKQNHDIRTIVLKNRNVFKIEQSWESQIGIGDSLYKKKGTLILEVYKKQSKKMVLDYRTLIPSE